MACTAIASQFADIRARDLRVPGTEAILNLMRCSIGYFSNDGRESNSRKSRPFSHLMVTSTGNVAYAVDLGGISYQGLCSYRELRNRGSNPSGRTIPRFICVRIRGNVDSAALVDKGVFCHRAITLNGHTLSAIAPHVYREQGGYIQTSGVRIPPAARYDVRRTLNPVERTAGCSTRLRTLPPGQRDVIVATGAYRSDTCVGRRSGAVRLK